MQFDRGYLSALLHHQHGKNDRRLEDAYVLSTRKAVGAAAMLPVLEASCSPAVRSSSRRDVEGEALATLVVTTARRLEGPAVKAPGFGDRASPLLETSRSSARAS